MEEDDYLPQDENIQEERIENDNDIVRNNFKTTRRLRKQYDEFCIKKGTNRSERLRGFILFELKKEAEREAQKEKPKDLNSDVSIN